MMDKYEARLKTMQDIQNGGDGDGEGEEDSDADLSSEDEDAHTKPGPSPAHQKEVIKFGRAQEGTATTVEVKRLARVSNVAVVGKPAPRLL